MSFHRKACVFFVLSLLFMARHGRSQGHSLLQRSSSRSEFDCLLTPQELQSYSGGADGHWVVTDYGIESLEGDIQRLVNCTEDGDVLLFDVESPVQLRSRIAIPWNLTLSAFVEDSRMENGTLPEARRKTTILCPREDEGVFFVEASNCIFANFIFLNCSLNYRRGEEPYGIITTAGCGTSQNMGTIGFHHLEVEANFLSRSAALVVQEPSCSAIQIRDLRFTHNSCIGTCAASLVGRTEIQNIALTGNRFFEVDARTPILIGIRSGSNTTINGLTASGNNGTVVHVQDANLTLSNSRIFQNSGLVNQNGYDGASVTLLHSTGQILDCRFEENTADTGSAIAVRNSSGVIIRRALVMSSVALTMGGGVSLLDCSSVRILDSIIANNSATSRGGGVYSDNTTDLQIADTTFEMNSAQRGGGLYAEERDLEITSSSFQNNSASEDGAGLYLNNGNITFKDSVVTSNRAGRSGGGGYINHTLYSLTNLTFERNQAETGGGIHVEDSVGSLNKSYVARNSVGIFGGGLNMQTSNESVVHNCTFVNNTAAFGGGIYGTRLMLASMLSCRFVQNRAEHAGGGASFEEGNYTLKDNTFEENTSDESGGGFSCSHLTLNVTDTTFLRNGASNSGGGINVWGNTSAWFANCTWTANVALGNGGAAQFESGPNVVITDSSFHFNQAEFGGVYTSYLSITLLNVTGNDNRVSESGAVLHLVQSNGTVSNCKFARNHASDGGAVSAYNSEAFIFVSRFESNEASLRGGAVRGIESSKLTIDDCRFDSNSANVSGGSIFVSESAAYATNLQFQNSTARYGGALGSYDSTSVVFTSRFVSNQVALDGGAIDSEGSGYLTIEDCSFVSNSADRDGGAIIATESVVSVTNLRLQNNSALRFGGAVFLQTIASAFFSHSVFDSESSRYRGGALSVTETTLSARNISIASCSAVRGGGICFHRSVANISETSVTFSDASEVGGGIYMVESNVTSTGLNISFNTVIGTTRYRQEGGGITVESSSNLTLRNATIAGNKAQYGAGIFGIGKSVVILEDSKLHNNSATERGGAASIYESLVTIERLFFEENRALHGGSIHVFNSNLTLNDSQLINDSSTHTGGSILAEEGSNVVMERTTIQSSSAEYGGGITLINSNLRGFRVQFLNCLARVHGGGLGLNKSSSFLCTDCLFEGNSASQEGGAVELKSATPQKLAFQLANTVFRNNDAAFGGAIHFQTGDGSANCSDVSSTECTFLGLIGCVFTNNHARFAGGAILANNPNAVRVSCDPLDTTDPYAYYTSEELGTLKELSSPDAVCDNWTENNASTYGTIVGSYARRVSMTIVDEQNIAVEVPGNRYVLYGHQSGHPLPTILLEAFDEFSQSPALIPGNQQIEAVMTSPDRLFEGIVAVRMELGRGNFPGITCYGEPGNHNIHINFSERALPALIVVVEIRHCVIGESRAANGTFCEPCGADSYNFYPLRNAQKCTPCPDDASCEFAAIQPKKGFWHQTPCSIHLQRCISEGACNEKGRDDKLRELELKITNCTFDDEFARNYSTALCREGYTGPLCGSCNTSHGKTRSFRCEECYGRFVSLFLVILVGLVLLGLAAFAIRSALPAHRHHGNRSQPRREESLSSPLVNIQMVEMWCTGIVPREMIYPHLRRHDNSANTAVAQQQVQTNAELTKRKATEIFKITINYLQVIAIAIAVNVAWTSALIGLFETAEFIGGLASEAANHSTNCLTSVHSSIPHSAVTTIVNLIIPVMVGVFFAVFWTVAMVRNKQGFNYLMKRCLLSALIVSYLSYIAITKTAVNTFYCVDVHDSIDFENNSTTKYWAVDTALKCYEGSHNVLAFVFGLPVLVLFSLGFPVLVAYVLITKRNQEGIQSPWLFETAGFLYRCYDQRFIFGESVILLRKATLAVIVVFAYPLGGNLQGLLAVCVLLIALYFHTLCSPYRSELEALNRLEGLSLLISSLTFASGLFFNDDRTSSEARAIIAVFVIIANVGIFLYFCVRFFVAGVMYLAFVLDDEGVPYDRNGTVFHIFKVFVKNRLENFFGVVLTCIGVLTFKFDNRFTQEEGLGDVARDF